MTKPVVMTAAQLRVLKRASRRKDGALHPVPDVFGDALRQLEEALVRRGFVTQTPTPVITQEGREALARIEGAHQ